MSHLEGVAPGGVVPRGCGTKGVWHISKFVNRHNFVIFYASNLRFCMEIHSDFLPLQPGMSHLEGVAPRACGT